MAAKKQNAVPEDKLRLYEALIATLEEVDTKSKFGAGYTAVNGNMYSMISKHGIVGLRIPPAMRGEFIAKFGAEPFRGDPAWPPSKELLAIPDELLAQTDMLKPYMRASY